MHCGPSSFDSERPHDLFGKKVSKSRKKSVNDFNYKKKKSQQWKIKNLLDQASSEISRQPHCQVTQLKWTINCPGKKQFAMRHFMDRLEIHGSSNHPAHQAEALWTICLHLGWNPFLQALKGQVASVCFIFEESLGQDVWHLQRKSCIRVTLNDKVHLVQTGKGISECEWITAEARLWLSEYKDIHAWKFIQIAAYCANLKLTTYFLTCCLVGIGQSGFSLRLRETKVRNSVHTLVLYWSLLPKKMIQLSLLLKNYPPTHLSFGAGSPLTSSAFSSGSASISSTCSSAFSLLFFSSAASSVLTSGLFVCSSGVGSSSGLSDDSLSGIRDSFEISWSEEGIRLCKLCTHSWPPEHLPSSAWPLNGKEQRKH